MHAISQQPEHRVRPRVLPAQAYSSLIVGQRCRTLTRERAETKMLTIDPDLCNPGVTSARHPFEAGVCSAATFPLVSHIHTVIAYAQIAAAVIKGVAVLVVNHLSFGRFAKHLPMKFLRIGASNSPATRLTLVCIPRLGFEVMCIFRAEKPYQRSREIGEDVVAALTRPLIPIHSV
jgi:hypothetical protein